MKRFILPLIIMILNSCNMFGQKSNECGGIVKNVRNTKPLENVSGEISTLILEVYNMEWQDNQMPLILNCDFSEGKFSGSISRDQYHDSYKFELDANEKLIKNLSNALKTSGILQSNNWNVIVAGLPPTYDVYISAKFSSGEKLYINFNGGRAPIGFKNCLMKFVKTICNLTDYSPEKCPEPKPYVNPYIGTHKFVYNKNGKSQTFIFILEKSGGEDGNSEVISQGDFGYIHLRCAANKVSGKYHFDVLRHYEDSKITNVQKNSLAGIISLKNDTFYLEPLQACPDLSDRSLLKKE